MSDTYESGIGFCCVYGRFSGQPVLCRQGTEAFVEGQPHGVGLVLTREGIFIMKYTWEFEGVPFNSEQDCATHKASPNH